MFGDCMTQQDRSAGENEEGQPMAETPCQPVLDNIADVGAARGNARDRRDMIGFERMLHAQQKADSQHSEHALPDSALPNTPYAKTASRLLPISLRSQSYHLFSPSPLRGA